jgi:hypothetical protein
MVPAIAKSIAPQQDQGVVQIPTGAGLRDPLRGFSVPKQVLENNGNPTARVLPEPPWMVDLPRIGPGDRATRMKAAEAR